MWANLKLGVYLGPQTHPILPPTVFMACNLDSSHFRNPLWLCIFSALGECESLKEQSSNVELAYPSTVRWVLPS